MPACLGMAGLTNWFWFWLAAAEVVWLVWASAYLVLQRRSASATLAWILALGFLPVVGIFFYFFFGPRRFDKRKHRRAIAQKEVERWVRSKPSDAAGRRVTSRAQHLIRLALRAVGPAAEPQLARVQLYTSGDLLFQAILDAVAAATHHVHLEYYIWEPDGIGTRLRDALIERARAGIEVRVIVDGFGSSRAHQQFWQPLLAAGGQVCRFNAFSFASWRPRMANFRTHRKIVVVDGTVAFTGGMNVADVHTREFHGPKAWRDTHLRLEGDGAVGLQRVFFEDWHYATRASLDLRPYLVTGVSEDSTRSALVQVVSSGPDENLDAIHKTYVAAIAAARDSVCLTTPYFVPDQALVAALATAALAGASVRVLVPAAGDVPLVAAAARSYYPELLEVGVRIFEYEAPVLHAKTLVVDDTVAIVGTANADNRSFRLNFEVIAAVYDGSVCASLQSSFDGDLGQAREVGLAQVKGASLLTRLWVSSARLLSPVL